ncbi:MAG TPA: hypothetical protein VMS86_09465, partial [Thermoanaerobaculia bacterium]|nr:hypothetical protein [Thermoanaerobaculia bacterium]
MSEPPRLFFTGISLEQAVLTAAQHYGCEPDDLAYERVERRYGFLRVRRNVVIKVDPKNPVRRRRPGSLEPARAGSPEAEIDDSPQPETQHDFNLHREPPRAAAGPAQRGAPGQRPAGQRGGAGQRGSGQRAERGPAQRAERGAGQRGQRGPGQRMHGGQHSERGALQSPRARGGESGEERGGPPRRRRRRRGGGRQAGDRRPVEGPALEFVPEKRELPKAEGEAAVLAASTAQRLAAFAGLDVEVEVLQGETELEVEIHGADQDLLFEDEGRLLLAIQHLLPRAMQGEIGEGTGVRVDSQGFRSQRVASLERLAREAADEVRRHGRPKTLPSMNP